MFNYKMTWESQLNNVIGKANKIIDTLKYLNRMSWGMEVNTALIIYRSYVRSILEYGIFIYISRGTLEVA